MKTKKMWNDEDLKKQAKNLCFPHTIYLEIEGTVVQRTYALNAELSWAVIVG